MNEQNGKPGINPDDFLVGEELQEFNPMAPVPTRQQQEVPLAAITTTEAAPTNDDLHTLEKTPNAARRSEIDQSVTQTVNKIDTVEDKVRKDVLEAQKKKFEGIPKTPKDVLKSLIAQGEYTKDFKMFGQIWKLRALDQSDTMLALDEVKDDYETGSGRMLALMFGTIIYSIEAINGISVYEWFEELKLQDYNNNRMEYHVAVRKALRSYLEAMPPGIVDVIYEKYMELDEERAGAIEKLKNS